MSKNSQATKTSSTAGSEESRKKKKSQPQRNTPSVKKDNLLVGVYAWAEVNADANSTQAPRVHLGVHNDLDNADNLKQFEALGHLWPVDTLSVVFRDSQELSEAVLVLQKAEVGDQRQWASLEGAKLDISADLVRKAVFASLRRNAVRSAKATPAEPAPFLQDDVRQKLVQLKQSLASSPAA